MKLNLLESQGIKSFLKGVRRKFKLANELMHAADLLCTSLLTCTAVICRSDLELIAEFVMKKCYLCSFNNGGHLFAVVGAGHVITIFNTVTHQIVATFKVG